MEYDKLVKFLGDLETEIGGTDLSNEWTDFLKAYPKI